MSKKHKKKQNRAEANIYAQPYMSAGDLQHIIANAIVEADEIKELNRRRSRENELKEWRAAIGYKEFVDKNPVLRRLKTFFNRSCAFGRICFIPKDKIKGDRFSFLLIKSFLEMTFLGAQLFFTAVTVSALALLFIHYISPLAMDTSDLNSISVTGVGLVSFLLSRSCRLASFEVGKLEDRDYLFSLCATIAAIVTVVGAAISIVKAVA